MEASIFIDGGNATLSIEIENFIVGNGNGDGHWNFSLNGETEVLNYFRFDSLKLNLRKNSG